MIDQARHDLALSELRLAQAAVPDDPQLYVLKSLALRQGPAPSLPEAEATLEEGAQRLPWDATIQLHLGQVRFERGADEQAESAFERALALAARDDATTQAAAHVGLVALFERQKRPERARAQRAAARLATPDVGEIIRQREMWAVTPPPAVGDNIPEGTGLHPPLPVRIRKVDEEIRRLERETDGR